MRPALIALTGLMLTTAGPSIAEDRHDFLRHIFFNTQVGYEHTLATCGQYEEAERQRTISNVAMAQYGELSLVHEMDKERGRRGRTSTWHGVAGSQECSPDNLPLYHDKARQRQDQLTGGALTWTGDEAPRPDNPPPVIRSEKTSEELLDDYFTEAERIFEKVEKEMNEATVRGE